MTEKEFDMQHWRRYDTVTLDTGLTVAISNVCFQTRSVRVFLKGVPQEWYKFDRIESHQAKMGGPTDDAAIIEELHNKVLKKGDQLEAAQARIKELEEKLREDKAKELMTAVNIIRSQLGEKKDRLAKLDACMDRIDAAIAKINNDIK